MRRHCSRASLICLPWWHRVAAGNDTILLHYIYHELFSDSAYCLVLDAESRTDETSSEVCVRRFLKVRVRPWVSAQ